MTNLVDRVAKAMYLAECQRLRDLYGGSSYSNWDDVDGEVYFNMARAAIKEMGRVLYYGIAQ